MHYTMENLKNMFKTEARIFKKLLVYKLNKDDRDWVIKYFEDELFYLKVSDMEDKELLDIKIKALKKVDKEELTQKIIVANKRLIELGLFNEDIFINPEDAEQSIRDYDYYYLPRTKAQYEKEEEEAKSGKSGRIPMD